MSEGFPSVVSRFPLSRKALARLRLKAIRRGVWFRVLKDRERRLLELTLDVVEKIRSLLLAKLVSHIVGKLLNALEGDLWRLMTRKGRSLAQKLSQIAQAWGNKSAVRWPDDMGFVKFLTVMNLSLFRTKAKASMIKR